MNNTIKLRFDNTLTRLAGFSFGQDIFETQVKNSVDLTKLCTIIFPNNIEKIASSFVQGFFTEIVKKIGFQGIEDNIKIETYSEELTYDIWNKLL